MAKPPKPTVPAPPLRSNPSTFSALAEGFLNFFQPFADYLDEVADFTDAEADAATAAALAGDLPGLVGEGGNALLVNPAEDGLAFGKVPVLLASQDLAGQTEFRFTGFDGARFGSYIFYFSNVTEGMRYRSSTDAITYDSGASDYSFNREGSNPNSSNADSNVVLSSGLTDTTVSYSGNVWMPHPDGTTQTVLRAEFFGRDTGGPDRADTIFYRNSTVAIQGAEFEAAGVNFPSGWATAYGIPR